MRFHLHYSAEKSIWFIHQEGETEPVDLPADAVDIWVEADTREQAKTQAKRELFPVQTAKHDAKLAANPEYREWLKSQKK